MNTNQVEEETKFKQSLTQFLNANGAVKGADFDISCGPFKIYQLVCRRGGYQAVTNRNDWYQVCLEASLKQNADKLKNYYLRYLFPYEKRNYFGSENDDEQPNMILGPPRKINKNDSNSQKPKNEEYTNLQNQISRALQQQQHTKKLIYLKKSKLNITKAETKKIILGLDNFMCRKDVTYSLNMLILYSVNNHPFLFENNQKIFTALSNYMQSIYPPKNQQQMEDLRTITLIFRNLTMNPINLKFMLGTSVFQILVTMFNIGFDNECSKNIVDIMNGLVKVGWDCNQILKEINNAILDDKYEDVQGSVELLRGLIDERDQTLAPAVTQNIKALLRVLMANDISIQIKQQIFQILAFVTDISSQSREELLKNQTLIYIIIGILQHMKNQQKLIQFVALTLSNISSAATAKTHLKKYESQLMMIGFSDDSLAGIISNILTQLSH